MLLKQAKLAWFELSVLQLQNATYFFIIVMSKKISFCSFHNTKFYAKHKKTHGNSIYVVWIAYKVSEWCLVHCFHCELTNYIIK